MSQGNGAAEISAECIEQALPTSAFWSPGGTNLRALVRASLLPVWLVDVDTTEIIEASGPVAQLLGGSRSEILEHRAVDFAVDKARAQALVALLASGALDSFHVRAQAYKRLDGSEMAADICMAVVSSSGSPRIAIGVLVQADGRMLPLAIAPHRSDPTTLGTVDADWKIDRISTDVEELLGYKAADLVGRSLANLVQPADWPVVLISVGHSLREDGATRTRLRLRTADGRTRWCAALVTPLAGADETGFAFSFTPGDEETGPVDRARELEAHMRRIAGELAAAGVLTALTLTPAATALPAMAGLSARELEIATRLLSGERVPLIAKEMFISQSTVRNHLTSVYRKLGVRSQQELITKLRASSDESGGEPPTGTT